MTRNFKEAVEHRRTYYNITNSSPISDHEIKELIAFAVKTYLLPSTRSQHESFFFWAKIIRSSGTSPKKH